MAPLFISYMPQLLPDELLYSLLGRLVGYNALGGPRVCLELLFGSKDVIPSIDLPTLIESLHHRLGSLSPCASADGIIDTGTIYPYHRPFLTIERHEAIRQILLRGGGKGLKTLLGRVANRFGANLPLQYCQECNEESIARHGVPYWRKSHQLPGVKCCATHRIDLISHTRPSSSTDRQRLILPTHTAVRQPFRISSCSQQVNFSVLSRDLLEAGLPALCPLERQAAYEVAIAALGFRTHRNRIDHTALSAAVKTFYNDFQGFVHRDRLLSTSSQPLAWLRTLLDRPSRSAHPICHLLLIGFLFKTIDGFKQAMLQVRPCIAQNLEQTIDAESSPTAGIRTQHDLLVRDTSLSCRKVAQVLNLSVTTVVSRRRALGLSIAERRKHLTSDRLEPIVNALAQGLALPAIARRYRVSVGTVYRVRAQTPKLVQEHTMNRKEQERRRRRKRWQQAINRYHKGGVTKVRLANPATYAWLYRHDRIWLQMTCKTLHRDRKVALRVNWAARDRQLCRRVTTLVTTLRRKKDRPRISKTLLLRELGDAMIRANRVRLPNLQVVLERLIESPETFQIFRIEQAIERLAVQGIPISLWRIQRAAGIRRWTDALRSHANQTAMRTFSNTVTS